MTWLEGSGLVALGLIVGAYGTMVGVGGGFFLVPVLLFMHYPPRVAAGTSLAVVFANAASGTLSYLQQRRVDIRIGLIFAIAGIPGALAGAYIDQHLSNRIFTLLFAAILLAVGARLFVGPPAAAAAVSHAQPGPTQPQLRAPARYQFASAGAVGIAVGFLASMFGIGGGVIQVPAMVYLFGFPTHVATATSQFTIAFTAFFGTASHVYFRDVVAVPAVLLSAGAIVGAQIGARISGRLRADRLLRWLSLAVMFASLYLIFGHR